MRRVLSFGLVVAALAAQAGVPAGRMFEDGKGLFNRRLGMFVHWGIYSVNGWHEQERWRKGVSRAEYENAAARFGAEKFDADALVRAAKSAGAEYLVFTAKHHDGFCLWETATTDFNVTKTPAGRDVLKEIAAACRRGGVKLGLYYSNPDWHHPNAYNPLSSHQVPPEPGDVPDLGKYREYVKAQLTELLTRYGEICCLFWDIPTHVPAPEMNALVRRLQPGILVNDRGWDESGDYSTPERKVPEGAEFPRPTEACDSLGWQSWGYRVNEDYHTLGYLTRRIDRALTMGGNFLLNVGPKADGTLPDEALRLLRQVGDWYGKVRESYRDVVATTNLVQNGLCMVTERPDAFYLHYNAGLGTCGVTTPPCAETPHKVTLLNTGAELPWEVAYQPKHFWGCEKRFDVLHVMGIPADELANECVVVKVARRVKEANR